MDVRFVHAPDRHRDACAEQTAARKCCLAAPHVLRQPLLPKAATVQEESEQLFRRPVLLKGGGLDTTGRGERSPLSAVSIARHVLYLAQCRGSSHDAGLGCQDVLPREPPRIYSPRRSRFGRACPFWLDECCLRGKPWGCTRLFTPAGSAAVNFSRTQLSRLLFLQSTSGIRPAVGRH